MARAAEPLAFDRRGGGGPTLVLLHALGADRRMWDPVLERLAVARDTLAVDLPGFGVSPPLDVEPTPRALAQRVGAFLEGVGVRRPHVVGCSLGGWVALELGLAGHACAVTAFAPAGLWPRPLAPRRRGARGHVRHLLPLVDALARSERGRRLLLGGSVAHPERVPARDAAHLVRSYMTAPGFEPASAAMRARRFADLARVEVPVTCVWPQFDRLVRRPDSLPSGVRSVSLPDAGHIPTWDAPDEIAAILLRQVSDQGWMSGC